LALEELLRLAEMGYEVAEVNAAKAMDMLSASSSISLVPTSTKDDLLRSLHSFFNLVGLSRLPLNSSQEAFLLYQRAAEQGSCNDFAQHGGASGQGQLQEC
jgi:hypothetical protein